MSFLDSHVREIGSRAEAPSPIQNLSPRLDRPNRKGFGAELMKRNRFLRGCLVVILFFAALFLACWFWVDIPFASHDLGREWARAEKNGFPLTADALKPPVPVRPEDNAAPLLGRAVALVDSRFAWQLQTLEQPVKAHGPTPAQRDGAIAKAGPALDLLAKAVEKPRLWVQRDYDLLIELQFPEYKVYKGLVHALCVRAEAKALKGDLPGAISDLRVGRRLSVLISTEPTLIGQLVAIALDKLVDLRVERIGALLIANAPELALLRKQVVEADPLETDLRIALRAEMYRSLTITRNGHRYGMGFNRRTDAQDEQPVIDKSAPIVRTGQPTAILARADLARAMAGWNDLLESPEWRSGSALPISRVQQRIAERLYEQGAHKLSYLAIGELLPEFTYAGSTLVQADEQRVTLDCLLKALEYHALHGSYPRTLAQAGADAPDPFLEAGRLTYMATPSSVKVWSVGRNGKDDGGDPTDGKDVVAMYPPRRE